MSRNGPLFRNQTVEYMRDSAVETEIAEHKTANPDVGRIFDAVPSVLGLSSLDAANGTGAFGVTVRAELAEAMVPQEAPPGTQPIEAYTSSLVLLGYQSGDSHVAAGVARMVAGPELGDPNRRISRPILLETSDYRTVVERTVTDGALVVVDGWWDALRDCLVGRCAGECTNAALECPPASWPVYLACLAGRCGGCLAGCVGCATCDCGWLCRVAFGCCHQ
ncbi:hypothetical protein SAMN05216532_2943 [Streptomyces sp. 2231.1]|uniref:hypothetical protein n=1 Tax=Streptomyces sp. 2231.1 TaxID=1855347 RepID=UPI0008957502|nr:hypothetical protein [Streptomyces sp. 2231.1]SEC96234.1 hypothetical protein SAMN05216532_2943 [Streptomyces sp. 2231.1]